MLGSRSRVVPPAAATNNVILSSAAMFVTFATKCHYNVISMFNIPVIDIYNSNICDTFPDLVIKLCQFTAVSFIKFQRHLYSVNGGYLMVLINQTAVYSHYLQLLRQTNILRNMK